MKNWLFIPLLLLFAACTLDPDDPTPEPLQVEGLRPIYVAEAEAKEIKSLPAQAIRRLGKIYYKDATIYVNESNLGVHVIDNSDPTHPVKKKFLQIPGCRDIAIKGNFLYADNIGDLVTIDISDINDIKVVKRLPGIQGGVSQKYPEFYEGYFECVEEGKGVVIGWETAMLIDPKCWR